MPASRGQGRFSNLPEVVHSRLHSSVAQLVETERLSGEVDKRVHDAYQLIEIGKLTLEGAQRDRARTDEVLEESNGSFMSLIVSALPQANKSSEAQELIVRAWYTVQEAREDKSYHGGIKRMFRTPLFDDYLHGFRRIQEGGKTLVLKGDNLDSSRDRAHTGQIVTVRPLPALGVYSEYGDETLYVDLLPEIQRRELKSGTRPYQPAVAIKLEDIPTSIIIGEDDIKDYFLNTFKPKKFNIADNLRFRETLGDLDLGEDGVSVAQAIDSRVLKDMLKELGCTGQGEWEGQRARAYIAAINLREIKHSEAVKHVYDTILDVIAARVADDTVNTDTLVETLAIANSSSNVASLDRQIEAKRQLLERAAALSEEVAGILEAN